MYKIISPAQITKIRGEIIQAFITQIVGKSKPEVKTEPKKEPIVEKNNSFQIFSQALSHFKYSDSNGIVWLAKKTGIKNKINDETKIEIK